MTQLPAIFLTRFLSLEDIISTPETQMYAQGQVSENGKFI